jgi:hypothetical protein
LKNTQDLGQAQQLLEEYHCYRAATQKELYQQLKKSGKHKRFIDSFLENPLRFLLYFGFSAFIVFLFIKMLFEFGL